MHLVLHTETISGGSAPSTSTHGHVYIDWVAADQPTTSSPSGEPMPVGDLPGWRQVFSDDFTQSLGARQFPAALASPWSAYADGWRDTNSKGTYYPSGISWHDGLMHAPIGWDGAHFMVNAPVPLLPTMLYGRYAPLRTDSGTVRPPARMTLRIMSRGEQVEGVDHRCRRLHVLAAE